MRAFVCERGTAVALLRDNIDTDAILPKQFLKRITRRGFGECLFYDWRFLPEGGENPDFVLNTPAGRTAKFLLCGDNIGCGSSREHAVWALTDYGIRAIIAESFADIFYNNCFNNGLLPIALPRATILELAASDTAPELIVNLETLSIGCAGKDYPFTLDAFRREMLLKGLDEIERTLLRRDAIAAFEAHHRQTFPWFF